MTYQEFLDSKAIVSQSPGIEPKETHKILFDFQRDIVKWALRRGRAAVFSDCGTGKTIMQLSWASQIPGDTLVLCPLAVAEQTVEEGKKLGLKINYVRDDSDVRKGINITNYQKLEKFDCSRFTGVVLDESSIVKHHEGHYRNLLIEVFSKTPYRSCWTATPAPNDHMELGNHAEFLGIMSRTEMLSMFFVHDGGETQKWRLKGHARDAFWKWVASWAVMIQKPSDLGYEDRDFILPPMEVISHTVEHKSKQKRVGLLPWRASSLPERIVARRESVVERCELGARLIEQFPDQNASWVIWCNLNKEADLMQKLVPGSVQVKGGDSEEDRIEKLRGFRSGKYRVMISKGSITGYGQNWQHCYLEMFIGLTDSWEMFYQQARRCWRFGQKKNVKINIVTAKAEGAVLKNILRKEADAQKMLAGMLKHMKEITKKNLKGQTRTVDVFEEDTARGKNWIYNLGDCVDGVSKLKSDSIGYIIYSPPFDSLYTYSASWRDIGNATNRDQFFTHMQFLLKELFRVTMPGRCMSFHCMQLPTSKSRDGQIGMRDFRGDLIWACVQAGFIFASEVTIWKDPVTAMQRTKAIGLLWKQVKKDSALSRQGIADYLVTMRKPGENPKPIGHKPEEYPVRKWQQMASPVWMDINPSDTLQYRSAREQNDERHICPLQLEVIRRGMDLWSRPGDVVLSPFGGIASEGYVAVEMGRRFIGFELKKSYWKQGVGNLQNVEKSHGMKLVKR